MDTTKPVKKVSDLSGPALDWAVAKCEGVSLSQASLSWQVARHGCLQRPHAGNWDSSSSWSLAGPIIEREQIGFDTLPTLSLEEYPTGSKWQAICDHSEGGDAVFQYGPTPLIAAMRCYVASRLGDTVEIPEELI